MRVDGLTLALRPRSMAEAADLGVALVRSHAASVWRTFLPLYLVIVLLALASVEVATWLPGVLIFCVKPWLDRSLLFILSRAVFGQSTRFADLWRDKGSVWGGQLLRSLFWRRLSPWRSYTQPIEQLEGQRGSARRKRRDQLLRGRRGAASAMQGAFANVEIALELALLSFALWFAADGHLLEVLGALGDDESVARNLAIASVYALVVGFLEPFFVGAGFAMYLNRRVELEAWDIEQEFRVAFAAS
ncbi:MAG: hypothetical protein ABI589_05140 [Burkholderiales bacterium]